MPGKYGDSLYFRAFFLFLPGEHNHRSPGKEGG
jgi:hypothetical protein